MKSIYLTASGKRKLKKELVRTGRLIKRLQARLKETYRWNETRENGDFEVISDNYEYASSRFQQLRDLLDHAKTLPKSAARNIIGLGSTVRLRRRRQAIDYTIVGEFEADPSQGKISDKSLLGQALLGKSVNETVSLDLPSGQARYQVAAIR